MTRKELHEAIETHILAYPERQKILDEMHQEWSEFKRKTLYILLGAVGSLLAIGVWVGSLQTNIDSVLKDHDRVDSHFSDVERRVGQLEINNGEIRARLASIESTLIEIKLAIQKI